MLALQGKIITGNVMAIDRTKPSFMTFAPNVDGNNFITSPGIFPS